MAERFSAGDNAGVGSARTKPTPGFSRGGLIVGLLLVTLIAAAISFGLARLRSGPNPGRVLYGSTDGVYERDLESGKDTRVEALPKDVVAVLPAPDGKWVAYARGAGEVWLSEIGGDRKFQVAERFTAPLGWSPDGRLIAGELLSDGDLVATNPEGGRKVLLTGGYVTGSAPAWLDDDHFAIAKTESTFVLVDVSESKAKISKAIDGTPLAASPDGAELLLDRDKTIVVAKVSGESLSNERVVFRGRATRVAASAQGFVAIAGTDGKNRSGVWVLESDKKSKRIVTDPVDWLGWSSEGSSLVYARKGAVYAVGVRGGEPKRVSKRGVNVLPLFSFIVVP